MSGIRVISAFRWAALLPVALLVAVTGGCSPKVSEPAAGAAIPRLDLRLKAQNDLRNIGRAYAMAAISHLPRNWDDLKESMEGHTPLSSPRDKQPYEVVWGVDAGKLQTPSTETLLAWEQTADADGGRCVLMADCQSAKYVKDEEFQKLPKAKGK